MVERHLPNTNDTESTAAPNASCLVAPELCENSCKRIPLDTRLRIATIAAQHRLPITEALYCVESWLLRLANGEYRNGILHKAYASLELRLLDEIGSYRRQFELQEFRYTVRRTIRHPGPQAEAVLKINIRNENKLLHVVAEGDNVKNTILSAMDKILAEVTPECMPLQMVPCQETTIADASHHCVTVQTTDGKHTWNTIGWAPNYAEAMVLAVLESIEYKVFVDSL